MNFHQWWPPRKSFASPLEKSTIVPPDPAKFQCPCIRHLPQVHSRCDVFINSVNCLPQSPCGNMSFTSQAPLLRACVVDMLHCLAGHIRSGQQSIRVPVHEETEGHRWPGPGQHFVDPEDAKYPVQALQGR